MAHTAQPGWRVTDDGPYVRIEDDGRVGRAVMINGSDKERLCNARMLAAAPDMLAALQSLMEFWDNGTPVQPSALAVDEARAAIAKATGGEA